MAAVVSSDENRRGSARAAWAGYAAASLGEGVALVERADMATMAVPDLTLLVDQGLGVAGPVAFDAGVPAVPLRGPRPRILFVDDEPHVLAALYRMLRGQQDRWELSFAAGGMQALAAMQARPCDVVVADYRMPEMDGAQLLKAVRDRYPGTARLVLSGHADVGDVLKFLLAHQFLTKPSSHEQLVAAIERVVGR